MISVVVPAYNEAALLGTTVRDMVDGLRSLDLEFELHIVENGSTDGTPAVATRIAEALAEVEVHSMRTANYGEALHDSVLRDSFVHSAILIVYYAVFPVIIGLVLTAALTRSVIRGASINGSGSRRVSKRMFAAKIPKLPRR
mgnify:CR=1 FL=1